ncbi:MAG: hypothetical protein IPJ65_15535 [Archangiaceae bacterium]|nr:hypothetical protein [Archangiaceae bacterium]
MPTAIKAAAEPPRYTAPPQLAAALLKVKGAAVKDSSRLPAQKGKAPMVGTPYLKLDPAGTRLLRIRQAASSTQGRDAAVPAEVLIETRHQTRDGRPAPSTFVSLGAPARGVALRPDFFQGTPSARLGQGTRAGPDAPTRYTVGLLAGSLYLGDETRFQGNTTGTNYMFALPEY